MNKLIASVIALSIQQSYAVSTTNNQPDIPTYCEQNFTQCVYDSNGRVQFYTNEYDEEVSIQYNELNQVSSITNSKKGIVSFKYNTEGLRTEKKIGTDRTIEYQYDNLGRVTSRLENGLLVYKYTYDECKYGDGQLCSVRGNQYSSAYSYKADGSLEKVTKRIHQNIVTKTGLSSFNSRVRRSISDNNLSANNDDGIISVNADGVPSFDETHPDFHHYFLSNFCDNSSSWCNYRNAKQGLLRFPAPGGNGSPIRDEQVSVVKSLGYTIGSVRHEVYNQGETVINVTLKNHDLYPGIVKRWVTNASNVTTTNTYGEGTGAYGGPNVWLADTLWNSVDKDLFNYMKKL
ncbi:hypothetical protein H0A36_24800 [Endozoicomonas sp. SM1973]|uniref:RHS repeat protein n=1 Tax=Spartinivicinus marinus TaxID=2994442 RepID=A0A853IBM7_9GAMM|nr:hypothetical protein [Spartinivicinus marinus]MCX4024938.1 hypothetical protein [Spartinivicinus marinus]NYZ69242.1 hypothetical protein [Spartinivicinus marinus]